MDFFFATLFSLFSIVDPPGAIPVYVALTSDRPRAERNRIALYTSLYFLLILVSFFLAGSYILGFFGLTVHSLRIAGGMTLLISGFGLMSGRFAKRRGYDKEVEKQSQDRSDIAFSPMAMPMLSGPGSISYLITQFSQHPGWSERSMILAAIVAVAILVWACLRVAPFLFRVFGAGGLNAIARIMGFIVIAIGVQFIVDGLVHLVKEMG
ncbi:MAG: NAAT family transporter [Saprospiraceae bacterium]|nr:NAAT family transporter [Saprospiraceae bacterium]MCB9353863.1 NAAT family transporter [Lewinellaceae bacterium]